MGNFYSLAQQIIGDLPIGYQFVHVIGALLIFMVVIFILLFPVIIILNLTSRRR